MKWLMAFLILIIFVFSVNSASMAEGNLSEMSIEALLELRDRINSEIASRLEFIDNNTIYAGDYTAGIHIKAGTYVITCIKENENASDGLVLGIYEPGEKYETNKNELTYYDFKDNAKQFIGLDLGQSASFTLLEGEHLIIKWGEGTLSPFAPFWAP